MASRASTTSPTSPVLHLLANVALLIAPAVVVLAVDNVFVWIAMWLVQSVALLGMVSAAHYASHNSLFRSPRANRTVGTLLLLPALLNAGTDQAYHRQHHAATRIDGDTEYHFDGRNIFSYAASLLFGGPSFVLEDWLLTARTVLGRPPDWVRTARQARRIKVDALVGVAWLSALVALTVVYPGAMVKVWLAPYFVALSGSVYLIVLPEHFRCEHNPDQRRSTRTVHTGRFFAWLYWNGNYHTAHHLNPNVNWRDLPSVHEALEPAIVHVSPSYRSFHLAALRAVLSGDQGSVQARRVREGSVEGAFG